MCIWKNARYHIRKQCNRNEPVGYANIITAPPLVVRNMQGAQGETAQP